MAVIAYIIVFESGVTGQASAELRNGLIDHHGSKQWAGPRKLRGIRIPNIASIHRELLSREKIKRLDFNTVFLSVKLHGELCFVCSNICLLEISVNFKFSLELEPAHTLSLQQ